MSDEDDSNHVLEQDHDENEDDIHNIMSLVETSMETGNDHEGDDDEDEGSRYDEGIVDIQPEILMKNQDDSMDNTFGEDDSFISEGLCKVCQGELALHINGQPCLDLSDENSSTSHPLFDHFADDSCSNLSAGSVSNASRTSFGSNKKTALGSNCPICGHILHKQHAREHISWHFMDELKSLIINPNHCPEPDCDYAGEKIDNVARHLALFHSKLDIYLSNSDLMEEKRQIAMTKPKRVSVGASCIICGIKDPAREHVARHFMKELMEIVSTLNDQTKCPDCPYRGEKAQNLARHIALVHSKLDELLLDEALVQERKNEFLSRPSKLIIGPNCPVCDQTLSKQHSRVHVIWHYMDELRAMVAEFEDPNRCQLCDYTNINSDKIAKHIALGHSKLDELLQNQTLLTEKRAKALTKPKKESIGPMCPICEVRDPPREHVARHFSTELNNHVASLPSQLECTECSYKGEKTKNLELHIALVHGLLDAFLKDKSLVAEKRQMFLSTPKKYMIGPQCPICDIKFSKSQNRDHVSWHFMTELREYVQSFPNPQNCIFCQYSSEKIDNLVKHIALGHSKLDELLQDKQLVAAKRAAALSKPKKVAIGPNCPVCDVKDPAREHVARHFGEELQIYMNELPDQCQCNECEYRADKPKTLGIHIALVHGKLDALLSNEEIVALKRDSFLAKPKKQIIGPKCPVCDIQFTKNQNRDHVSWHYMEELRVIVSQFPDPQQCTQCPYTSDTLEKMVKHVALGHSMLDQLLQDQELLEAKRIKALAKPKKIALGPTCPVCDVKDPPREHVARHFSDELMDIVMDFPDTTQCTDCSYKNDRPKNVAIHIALVHNILDQILTNQELVQEKRNKFLSKPQKYILGDKCPICETPFTKGPNRDHVCWHFMEELREIVNGFDNQETCPECSYTTDKLDNLVKHIALGHSKLDELLQNDDLVAQKRELALSKPKKITIGNSCPVCDIKFSKGQNRDHVSWHFMDELREFVRQTGQEKACTLCYYTTDKVDNLVKHYALGHCKLDELLQDKDLIQSKREAMKKKPKRLSFGKDCPICGQKGRDRDHIARHFMPELMELVNALPKKSKCDQCTYSNSRNDYMAKHIALFHCKLDEMMLDKELVKTKIEQAKKTPKKVSMGENCLICNLSMPSREHVARHFLNELSTIVSQSSPSPLSCPECPFTAEKAEYVARHMGLVHCKMDELISDPEVVAKKITEYQGTLGATGSPLPSAVPLKALPIRESVRKSQRQKEQEERQAREQKEKEEREKQIKEEEKIRKRELAEQKRLAEEEAKQASALSKSQSSFSTSPTLSLSSSLTALASKFRSPHLENELKMPHLIKPSESLLKSTLLKPPAAKIPKLDSSDIEENEQGLEDNDGSLQIKIKRTTPAQWQIKQKHESDGEGEGAFSSGEHHEIEPDISHLMEINHHVSDDEDEKENEDEEGEGMVICPEIIINDGHPEEHNDTYAEDVLCEVCGFEIVNHSEPCDASFAVKYSKCPICTDDSPPTPSREHVAKHFAAELTEVIEALPDPTSCTQCEFKGTIDLMAVHIAVAHGHLEKCLSDTSLVSAKRNEAFARSLEIQHQKSQIQRTLLPQNSAMDRNVVNQTASGQVVCTICDQSLSKSHSRDHTVWHFMDELRAMIGINPANGPPEIGTVISCPECNYSAEKSDNVARHLALFHGHLDVFLQDKLMVAQKRMKCLSKPKKVSIGSTCPVCDFKDPPREHVSRHFFPELLAHLETLPDQYQCSECNYRGDRPQNLAKHIALVHSMLDELLRNTELVQAKREEFLAKPKKVSIGDHCPVCEVEIPKRDSRVHVIWHFMEDLREMVANFADQRICDICGYQNTRPDKMAKHLALGHSKLDELLMNEELVALKKENLTVKPKKVMIGQLCPICDLKFPKNPNRDHIAWHFMDELRDMVAQFEDQNACPQCPYTSDKVDNLVKHIALGHSKLDELLLDKNLVAIKRESVLGKPKKISIGASCPICDMKFNKGQNRDHVSCHFNEELKELANSFPDPKACIMCEYTTEKMENMVKHLALGHSKLDEFLLNKELVAAKRAKALSKPKKFPLGQLCPICDLKNPQREHVLRHFMEELLEYVKVRMPDETSCNECSFKGERIDNLARHLGLFHSKMDELLYNNQFVQGKRRQFKQKMMQQQQTQPAASSPSSAVTTVSNEGQCKVCGMRMLKKSVREHMAKHFFPELADAIIHFKRPNACDLCTYRGKRDALLKHVALVHGKLEQYLSDSELMERKRQEKRGQQPLVTKKIQQELESRGASLSVTPIKKEEIKPKLEVGLKQEEESENSAEVKHEEPEVKEEINEGDDSSSSSDSSNSDDSSSRSESGKSDEDEDEDQDDKSRVNVINSGGSGLKLTFTRSPKKTTPKVREEFLTSEDLVKKRKATTEATPGNAKKLK